MNAVSDSDVVIDWLQGLPQATETLASYTTVFISAVSYIEVLSGARSAAEDAATRRALQALDVEPLGSAIMELAIEARRQQRLKLPDAAILATARHLGLPLLTRNTRDFDPRDPLVRIPYAV